MNLIETLKRRYTTKAYDASRQLPENIVAQLLAALHSAPASVNSQPWHFIVAEDAAGKARIAKGMTGPFVYNAAKVTDASHVVVLCARDTFPPAYLQSLLDQEQADGRFANEDAREAQRKSRGGYVAIHEGLNDVPAWTKNQTYLALGFLLLAAGSLGVDATPMEGFDAAALAAEFDLPAKGFSAAVVVALGYHAENDFNAKLPKSRLPADVIFSRA